METIYFEKANEAKKNLALLEKKLNVKIKFEGKKANIEGEAIDEYEAMKILEAIAFGFPAKKALLLMNENYMFTKINIKKFTRRKNLEDVRARVIGSEGKTKRTIENLSGCEMIIRDNEVGILGPVDEIEHAVTAVGNVARGTKQANVYAYLERMNASMRNKSDLGLKPQNDEEKSTEDDEETGEEEEY